ncbi:efflux RND transporter permease subunit [Roseimaritima ulvae]|uniref:Multidrug resistance protein MdtB n=1 Tax=Roseimaritima ulvae TaxID=980254 RepID=A0A5B9QMI8_9BACT|nr:efflux RND transporter permease subunit [Roseimaritima ulvae]QEG38840.1 Multidrug resistance protein MdtB [Roseimaritima ulvae]
MKRIIAWAIASSPGMNVIMVASMLVGAVCLYRMRREVFPEFELEVVMVTVPYPGATPEDVEQGICQLIEEPVRSLEGVKKVTSIAQEGAGFVLIELLSDVQDVQKVLAEIDREVSRISNFPDLAEDPQIQQITFRDAAIRIGIVGPESLDEYSERQLRAVAEDVRDDVLQLPSVSAADVMGGRNFQIDVEISEGTLRQYDLSLGEVAQRLRARNIELPGGQLRAEGQEVLFRAKNKGRVGDEIRQLPLITQPGGVVLTVDDLGTVRDDFEDTTNISEINGQPAMVVNVNRTKSEDLLAMTTAVREYVKNKELPAGYRFVIWGDTSTDVRDRLQLLLRNGAQGLALVFLVLALFLEIRLAVWVAMGIPISILGAGIALTWGDQTLNMLSLFSFLVALGIVVDDAIVVGENIYAHRQMGKNYLQAAIDGAAEVVPSVTASVMTTVIAFGPMFFVSGVMGKFMAVIPFAVIAMLAISLLESMFVLPCHLAHRHNGFFVVLNVLLYPLRPVGILLHWLNARTSRGMEWIAERIYMPTLRFCLHYPLVPIAATFGMCIFTAGMVRGGIVPRILFPKSDNNLMQATVTFPDGTPVAVTNAATSRMEEAIRELSVEIAAERAAREGQPIEDIYPNAGGEVVGPVQLTYRQVGSITNTQGPMGDSGGGGSHVGQIFVELFDTTIRDIHSDEILARWRAKVGDFAGMEKITYGSVGVGPGGKAIEFKLLASDGAADQLEAATEAVKQRLAEFQGLYDIGDDNTPGKWEFQLKVKDQALATGVTEEDLGNTVRNAYYGAEVMRLQRGRHEVKLMVRYPEEQRSSLADYQEIRVRTPDGAERPITEVAEVNVIRGYSEINRVNQMRSITISADLDETKTGPDLVINELKDNFLPELQKQYPAISVRWEGQREQSEESVGSLLTGFVVAIIAMYILLVLQFRSYLQPLIILAIIPFGMIGAIWGHAFLGLPLTLFSMFGLVALAGVVVNDSIVLIDFINARVREGVPKYKALLEAGLRRFRPVMLTSMTTIAGLLPLLTEKSFQAQLLIPMAASLAFGLMLATALVLLMIPILYMFYLYIIDLFGLSPVDDELVEQRLQMEIESV